MLSLHYYISIEISTSVTSPSAPVVSLHVIIIPAVIAAGLLILFGVVLTVCLIVLIKGELWDCSVYESICI